MENKQRKSIFSDKSLQSNAYLIKLIIGEIFDALPSSEQQELILDKIQQSYWYQKTII